MNTTILLEQLTLLDNQLQYSKQEVEFWKKKYEDLNSVVINQSIINIEELNSLKQSFDSLKNSIEQIDNERKYYKDLAEFYISQDHPDGDEN